MKIVLKCQLNCQNVYQFSGCIQREPWLRGSRPRQIYTLNSFSNYRIYKDSLLLVISLGPLKHTDLLFV